MRMFGVRIMPSRSGRPPLTRRSPAAENGLKREETGGNIAPADIAALRGEGGIMRLSVLALAPLLTIAFAQPRAASHTLIVDDDMADCPNADFTSIQAAVAAADPGTRIVVCPGTYTENVLIETHAKDGVQLIGEGGSERVILDGLLGTAAPTGYNGITLRDVSDVLVRGFTVTRFHENIFLQVGANGNRIMHNVLKGPSAHDGINTNNADGNVITHNEIFQNGIAPRGCGVDLQTGSENNLVAHNVIYLHDRAGIRLRLAGPGNVVVHNKSFLNGNGVMNENTSGSVIEHNFLAENLLHLGGDQRGVGIRMLATGTSVTTSNVVRFNHVWRNQSDGIALENADGNSIANNESDENGRDGIWANLLSADNLIERNRMHANAEHDCHDDSVGPGTAGTANFWIHNHGDTENRPGLCQDHDD
jgi:hypothetical protein